MELTLGSVSVSDRTKKLNIWTVGLTPPGLDRTTLDKVLGFSKPFFKYLFPIYHPQHFFEAKMQVCVCVKTLCKL